MPSLFRAGVATVVAAQWPVADISSMFFMVELHRLLHGDHDVGAAVRDAGHYLRNLKGHDISDRGIEFAKQLAPVASVADHHIRVAAGCVREALRATRDPLLSVLDELTGSGLAGVSLEQLEQLRLQTEPNVRSIIQFIGAR